MANNVTRSKPSRGDTDATATLFVTEPRPSSSSPRSSMSGSNAQLSSRPASRPSSQLAYPAPGQLQTASNNRTSETATADPSAISRRSTPALVRDPHYMPDPARNQGVRPSSVSSWSTADTELRDSLRRDSGDHNGKASQSLMVVPSPLPSSDVEKPFDLDFERYYQQRSEATPQTRHIPRPFTEPSHLARSHNVRDRGNWPGPMQRPFTLGMGLQRQMSPPIHPHGPQYPHLMSFRPGPPSSVQQNYTSQGMPFPLSSPPLSYASSTSQWIPSPLTPPTLEGSLMLPPHESSARVPPNMMIGGTGGGGGFFPGARPFSHDSQQEVPFPRPFITSSMRNGSGDSIARAGAQFW